MERGQALTLTLTPIDQVGSPPRGQAAAARALATGTSTHLVTPDLPRAAIPTQLRLRQSAHFHSTSTLASALVTSTTLSQGGPAARSVDMRECSLQPEGAAIIGEAMLQNCRLERLLLSREELKVQELSGAVSVR